MGMGPIGMEEDIRCENAVWCNDHVCPPPLDNTFDFTAITKQMRLNANMLMQEMTEHAEKLKMEIRECTKPSNLKDKFDERSKREDSRFVYILYELSAICPRADKKGEVYSKDEANAWVSNNHFRFWHEHIRAAVL